MTVPVIVAIVVTVLVLGIGGLSTRIDSWYRDLKKPPWNPPNWLFGPAWTLILGLAAWAGVLAWGAAPGPAERAWILAAFGVNIVFHMLWSPLFFGFKRPDWAMIEVPFLWLSVLGLILVAAPLSPLAGLLLAPYLAWVAFAAFLNLTIIRLNGPFGGHARQAHR